MSRKFLASIASWGLWCLLSGGLAGCGGDFSNDDLEFLNAFPLKSDLAVKLPGEQGEGGTQLREWAQPAPSPLLLGQPSQAYQATRDVALFFNGLLDAMLKLVEQVQRLPPTEREPGRRVWGPFAAELNPNWRVQAVMERTSGNEYRYRFEFIRGDAPAGTEPFVFLSGSFKATGGVRKGQGTLTLFAQGSRDAGLRTEGLDDLKALTVTYSTDSTPVVVHMALDGVSFNRFEYDYRELGEGTGRLEFQMRRNLLGGLLSPEELFRAQSRWIPAGGRTDYEILEGDGLGARQIECWDPGFNIVFAQKSWELTSEGTLAACPDVSTLD